ncbi:hypothetical protein NUU61_007428 [Penicillium alfredii]|uniref:Uncharacterized protein n=1 Tax=Penicillium alfredii TaxID=1506179 RepID=A0A9W9F2Q1_9EURO|nr:uncharacterized protein NUU61_007428 [Penicillium alfredii]KAJ5092558.1 hypothetical protein NUU61_007428 [Penicillium alfredii]
MSLVASSKNLLLRYWNRPIMPPVASRYLGSPLHPIRPKISHIYASRDRDTLWWRVSIAPLQSLKRVVRSWCGRRVRLAFRQALHQQGFDELGRAIPSEFSPKEDLTGSLEITIRTPCVQASFETVQKDANHLLENILAQQATRLSGANCQPKETSKTSKTA